MLRFHITYYSCKNVPIVTGTQLEGDVHVMTLDGELFNVF